MRNKDVRLALLFAFVHGLAVVLCMRESRICVSRKLCMHCGDAATRARGRIAYEAANLRELLGTPAVAVHGEED